MLTITTNSFENDVLRADKPVLVDFWAQWCPYCRRIAPAFDKVGEQYADTLIDVYKRQGQQHRRHAPVEEYAEAKEQQGREHGVEKLRQVGGIVQIQLLDALRGQLGQPLSLIHI